MKTILFCLLVTSILGKVIRVNDEPIMCSSENNGYYSWLFKTMYISEINEKELLGYYGGKCFDKIYPSMIETDDEFLVTIFATTPSSFWCTELVLVSTGRTSKWGMMPMQGHYKYKFKKSSMTQNEITYTRKHGIRVLGSCSHFSSYPSEIFNFLKMFVGGFSKNPNIPIFGSKTPDYQIDANRRMLKDYLNYDVARRAKIIDIDYDKSNFKSGDFIGLTRFDGLDQFINVGSGSRLGHTTIAMWDEEDGELYITESQAGWYWPRDGIQRNKWEQWYEWAKNADMNIVHIPLKEEHRANFDIKKAWKRYYELEGYDYGFRNFLFASVDSKTDVLPNEFDIFFISILFQMVESIYADPIDMIVGEALNKRLGTNNLRIAGIYDELYKRDMDFADLMIIVEEEDWVYSNGPNYVCSCYVQTILKASGVYGDIEFNSQEQGPKDLYSMDIWDFSGNNPHPDCKKDMEENNLNVCQIYGKVVLRLDDNPGYLKAYDHMSETCPGKLPNFERTEGC